MTPGRAGQHRDIRSTSVDTLMDSDHKRQEEENLRDGNRMNQQDHESSAVETGSSNGVSMLTGSTFDWRDNKNSREIRPSQTRKTQPTKATDIRRGADIVVLPARKKRQCRQCLPHGGKKAILCKGWMESHAWRWKVLII
jgi:hypothetical protein